MKARCVFAMKPMYNDCGMIARCVHALMGFIGVSIKVSMAFEQDVYLP